MASDARRGDQNRPPLIEGRFMRCPRCKKRHDVLRFIPMGVIEEYMTETNPIYKCPSCRWVFSPSLTVAELTDFIAMHSQSQNPESNQ